MDSGPFASSLQHGWPRFGLLSPCRRPCLPATVGWMYPRTTLRCARDGVAVGAVVRGPAFTVRRRTLTRSTRIPSAVSLEPARTRTGAMMPMRRSTAGRRTDRATRVAARGRRKRAVICPAGTAADRAAAGWTRLRRQRTAYRRPFRRISRSTCTADCANVRPISRAGRRV